MVMEKIKTPEKLIRYINQCICGKKQFARNEFDCIAYENISNQQHLDGVLSMPLSNLTQLNKLIYNYFHNLKAQRKEDKYLSQFKGTLNYSDMNKIFYKSKKIADCSMSLGNNSKKSHRRTNGVNLFKLQNLYGKDKKGIMEDIRQEVFLYLWEAIRKFDRNKSKLKIDTFLSNTIHRKLLILDRKARSKKYNGKDIYVSDSNFFSTLLDNNMNDCEKFFDIDYKALKDIFHDSPNILKSLEEYGIFHCEKYIELPICRIADLAEKS